MGEVTTRATATPHPTSLDKEVTVVRVPVTAALEALIAGKNVHYGARELPLTALALCAAVLPDF